MTFSIITISYNARDEIENTIQSVLKQECRDYEYILIDGGSTDGTMDIIWKYKSAFVDKMVNYTCISEKDDGISDAFNKGIAKAKGEWIGIINAGDLLMENALKDLESLIKDNIDVLYGNLLWIEKSGAERIRKPSSKLKKLKYEMVLLHPATFIRKSAYQKYGLYRTDFKYAMDQELLYRFFLNKCNFIYVDKELAIMQAGGVSDKQIWSVLRETNKIPKLYGKSGFLTYFYFGYKYCKNRVSKLLRK